MFIGFKGIIKPPLRRRVFTFIVRKKVEYLID